MAINYTFDEFAKAVKDNNLYISDADMKLARKDPNIGMGIVNSKLGYLSAKTDEERAKFNEQAESYRKSAGGYIGGSDGSKYLPFLQTPDSFSYEDAPTYNNQWENTNKKTYEQIQNYAPFQYDVEKPVYTDSYAGTADELLDAIVNHGDFSYDHNTDPNYQAYAKQYRREGERAMADTLAQAAANTGGVASTAAVTAAQQADNYYGAQLSDKLPQLYDAAYNRWLDEFTLNQNKLAAVQGERANERDKYLSDVAQWESDRNFAREQYNDQYNKLLGALEYGMAMEQTDYDRHRDTVEDHNAKQQFTYNQLLDTIGYRQQEDATRFNNAINAFNTVGDTSLLEAEGIDTTQYQEQLKDAQLLAGYEAQTERLKALADDTTGETTEEELYGGFTKAEFNELMANNMENPGVAVGYVKAAGTDEAREAFRAFFGDETYKAYFGALNYSDAMNEAVAKLMTPESYARRQSVPDSKWPSYEEYVINTLYNSDISEDELIQIIVDLADKYGWEGY